MTPGRSDDQQYARLDRMELTRFKKEITSLTKMLRKKEQVLAMLTGFVEGRRWMVTCTQSRLILLFRLTFAEPEIIEIPLDNIISVEKKTGLFFGEITIIADAKKTVIRNIKKRKAEFFVDTIEDTMKKRQKRSAKKSLLKPAESDADLLEKPII